MSGTRGAAQPTRRAVLACLCAAVLAVLTGCSGSSSSGASSGSSSGTSAAAGSGTAAASGAVITIKDFAFTTPESVSPGATVTVRNTDGVAHTVTADGGGFDSPAPVGKSSFTAPTTPGSYSFHCTIHPEMHGTLVVR